jgi:hypothetical protein
VESRLVGITVGAGCQYLFTYYTGYLRGSKFNSGNVKFGLRSQTRSQGISFPFFFFPFLFPFFFAFEWQEDLARFGYRPDLHFKNPFLHFGYLPEHSVEILTILFLFLKNSKSGELGPSNPLLS